MGQREELEGALAEAEAELARAVAGREGADPDPAGADAHIDHVRASCRQARAALARLDRAEPASPSSEPTEKPIHRMEKPPARQSGSGKTIRQLLVAISGRPDARQASSRRLLARQGLMLLALVLAYLQFYFFDVQLQVSRLPSLSVPLFG
jgi:hypothetical protein